MSCRALSACCLCQDGRSSALTAPNGPAQSALISLALASAAAGADRVACVSVHGTGAHPVTFGPKPHNQGHLPACL